MKSGRLEQNQFCVLINFVVRYLELTVNSGRSAATDGEASASSASAKEGPANARIAAAMAALKRILNSRLTVSRRKENMSIDQEEEVEPEY